MPADTPIIAKLNVNQDGSVMTGELRFDLSGGDVQGRAKVAANSSSRSLVKRQSGSATAGRFQTRIELSGLFGGVPAHAQGGCTKQFVVQGTDKDGKPFTTKLEKPNYEFTPDLPRLGRNCTLNQAAGIAIRYDDVHFTPYPAGPVFGALQALTSQSAAEGSKTSSENNHGRICSPGKEKQNALPENS